MGYLDNSTVVVDAILTKEGRKLLATGNALNIRYFTLSGGTFNNVIGLLVH